MGRTSVVMGAINPSGILAASVAVLLIVGLPSPKVEATEGGGTSKALGVDNIQAGVMPPAGFNLTNFLVYYTADETLDSNGNPRPNLSNFDLSVWAETMRLRYVVPKFSLLGADVEFRVGWNIITSADVSFDVQTPFGTFHVEDSSVNVGDSLFGVILGWHFHRFHQMLGPEFFTPTGRFSNHALANVGRGYLSIGPSYWFTWYPIDELEISAAFIYLINCENPDTHYDSGNELSCDYNIAYSVAKDWQIAINGYAYKQVADDEIRGRIVGDGNRGQVLSFGPAIRWHPHGARFGVTFKWQHEELVENRASGERFILQGMYQF